MLSPYDLGNILLNENCFKIRIDDLVREANKGLKTRLIKGYVEVLGVEVGFTTSKTKFGGERIWFICPNCKRRIGTLYKHALEEIAGCRLCLNLKYKRQRFKGMIESSI